MVRIRFGSLVVMLSVLGACAQVQKTVDKITSKTPPPRPVQTAPPQPVVPTLPALPALQAGTYQCELKRMVQITGVSPDNKFIDIRWAAKNHRLAAVQSRSGAHRYENRVSGLTWIGVVGKSMLLDTNRGQQLANECRL